MINFGKKIVKLRLPVLIIAALLLVPSVLGMTHTRINYDMLDYLPDDIDTMKGQKILLDDFGKGAFSLVLVEGMEDREVSKLREQIEQVDHVESALWYDSLSDISVPKEIIPEQTYKKFNNGDTTVVAVFFDSSTSADETMRAIGQIRSLAGKRCFVSGMSAMVTDLKNLSENEEPIYVAIAVALSCAVMMLFLESWVLPFIFLISIGAAILLNLGTNYFLGETSFITKALSAVLQLAVTMDYSIFLWHSYSEQKIRFEGDKKRAMAHAISNTITSVLGSSTTTIAGFIALCFMSFTLGRDLGIVMAKGVLIGVIGCVTTLPALILLCDKLIEKTTHRVLMPNFAKLADFVTRKAWVFLAIFLIILGPALYGYTKAPVYYDLGSKLPEDMEYVVANTKLSEKFDMNSTHMLLVDSKMPAKDANGMLKEINKIDGIDFTLGFNSLVGSAVPEEIIPGSLKEVLKGDRYQLMLVGSEYHIATDEANAQIDKINETVKKYDPDGMVIGEGPCTKDLIKITDVDFQVVNIISVAAVFVIIAITLKSLSLPIILVSVIEFAIFINLGIPYYTGTTLPFVAPICVSTIQLGSTVDYAILMTTRYKKERFRGNEKRRAIATALCASTPSVIVSALGFFAATIGVKLYSGVDMISTICGLMARGAIISMFVVVLILPAMLMLFDKIILKTTIGMRPKA